MAHKFDEHYLHTEAKELREKGTPKVRFNHGEYRTAVIIAFIYMARMLGLFLLLPVFSVAATKYTGATEFSIGLALGIYALSQAILQIPIGILSDKIGRKKVILIGLSLFLIGSIFAALATSIEMLIIARLIQGMGAVSAACLAYIGDNVGADKQPRMMAVVGASIGTAFILSLVLGPVINKYAGIAAIFWVTAGLAALAIIASTKLNKGEPRNEANTLFSDYVRQLLKGQLLPIYLRIFILHAVLSASFFLIPYTVNHFFSMKNAGFYLYLPAAVIAFLAVMPTLKRQNNVPGMVIWMWLLIAIALAGMATGFAENYRYLFIPVLALFFFGFTYIEAMLPSSMLEHSTRNARGAISGVYTVCLFAGNFAGSLLGAKLYQLDRQHFPDSLNLPLGYYALATLTVTVFLVQTYILNLKDEEA